MSELFRVFGHQLRKDNDIVQDNTIQTVAAQAESTAKDRIIDMLEKQLQEAKEREEWLKAQLEKTTHLLENKNSENEPKPRKKFLGIF
jgi:hypothetical protein